MSYVAQLAANYISIFYDNP